jgi:hypothetical protein
LVVQGKPNIVLFHKLYWLIVLTYLCFAMFNYPVLHIFTATFPESTYGKICLKIPLDMSDLSSPGRLSVLAFCFLVEFCNQYLSHKVDRYKKCVCPKGNMATWGKYRRNLIGYKETSRYNTFWVIVSLLSTAIIVTSSFVKTAMLSPTNVFWIHNLITFTFTDIFHGLVIPMKMTIPWKSTNQRTVTSNFYIRKPVVLEPRRIITNFNPRQNHLTSTTNLPISPPHRFSYISQLPLLSPPSTPPAMPRTSVLPGGEGEPSNIMYCSGSSLRPTAHTRQKLKPLAVKHIDVLPSENEPCKGKGKGKGKGQCKGKCNNSYTTHRSINLIASSEKGNLPDVTD